jgi:hypothetical protein
MVHAAASSGLRGAGDRVNDPASDEFRARHRADAAAHRSLGEGGRTGPERQALVRALEGLVKVLSGPSARRFRIESTSHKGVEYEIGAVDADVTSRTMPPRA